jgi:hypothetical protein
MLMSTESVRPILVMVNWEVTCHILIAFGVFFVAYMDSFVPFAFVICII